MTNKDHPNHTKLFKIWPLISQLQTTFRQIPKPQRLCVDEHMIPFQSVSTLKQYMPLKSVKWGHKAHCLWGTDVVMYDFFYLFKKNKIEPLSGKPDLGASSNAVVNLAETIPNNAKHLFILTGGFLCSS